MSKHNNPSIISDGLVFAYDQVNPKSYVGPALKNFLTQIEPRGISDNGTTYRFFSGTEQVYIPEVGNLTSAYVDMYNDYSGGSGNCCPSPYGYGQNLAVTGNTQYTYGILYKSYNRYTNPNWMYHYEYNGGTYITEYGVHMVGGYSGQETHLGDGWYWSRAIFTTNANCNTMNTGSWMYQYATWNRFYVAKVVLLEGNWLQLHPKYWPNINTTRINTQNVKNLVANNTLTAQNLVYNNQGTFSFNGSSSYINIGSGTGINQFSADFAVCAWVMRQTGGPTWGNIFGDYYTNSTGNTNEWQLMIGNQEPVLFTFYRVGSGSIINQVSSGKSINEWINVVITRIGYTINLYVNGTLIQSQTNSQIFGTSTGNFNIGIDGNNSSEPFSGKIDSVLIYKNKGLLAEEVQQNYNATKTRYLGESRDVPATSGYALKQARPNLPSGYYWIQNSKMPNPLKMYVDMTEEGGGYDFYAFQGNGTSIGFVNGNHSGLALGLDLVYPRSKQHWIAMSNFVRNVLGSTGNEYFTTVYAVYRETTGGAGSRSGLYVNDIMRDPTYYGTGTPDWRVPDGGRWWLRDTTFGEPNGDYTAFNFLGGYTFPNPYTGQDIGFNDVFPQSYTTGGYYLVSTNAKP